MAESKYIEFSTMAMPEFARSSVGTVAKFLLSTHPNARAEASKFIKAACTKQKSICALKSTAILVEQSDGSWLRSAILEATMAKKRVQKSRRLSETETHIE